MKNLNELISDIYSKGYVAIDIPNNLEDFDFICDKMKNHWKSREVIVFLSETASQRIKNMVESKSENSHYGCFISKKTIRDFIFEYSIFINGITFFFIEKPRLNISIWADISSVNPKEMLICEDISIKTEELRIIKKWDNILGFSTK